MKLFVILSRVPYPLVKGDKLRAFHQLRELKKRHEIVLCCLHHKKDVTPDVRKALESISSEVHIFKLRKWQIFTNLFLSFVNGKPFQVMYFYQRQIHKKIHELIDKKNPDRIYCQLIRTAEYAKEEHDYSKVLDYQDAFSKGMDRRENKAKWPAREIFALERKRLIAYENIIFEYFESKTIISEEDRRHIYHPERNDIKVITNGIDTDFFTPNFTQGKIYDLVFTGNMNYAPNIETAIYIVEEVLPELRKKRPGITLLLAGSTPNKKVKALENHAGVTVSGWVEDIRISYAQGLVFFAPMQIGTGLQNKLLESMAMGVPCITSSLANRPLKAVENRDLIVQNDIEGYTEAIIQLLDSPDDRKRIGDAGRAFVKAHFSWAHSVELLEESFQ